jgi:hypothetical protein
MFWFGIGIAVLLVIGASVLIGASVGRRGGGRSGGDDRLSRREQLNALRASGALKHRKSNR